MITTVSDKEIAQAATIEALRHEITAWSVTAENLEAELEKQRRTHCACVFDGDTYVEQCELHAAWKDTLHEQADYRRERDALKAANRDLQDWYDAAIADAKRFDWLTADLDMAHGRVQRNQILDRMPTMSYSAACAAIDAIMQEANHD